MEAKIREKKNTQKKSQVENKIPKGGSCILLIYTAFCSQVVHMMNVTQWSINLSGEFLQTKHNFSEKKGSCNRDLIHLETANHFLSTNTLNTGIGPLSCYDKQTYSITVYFPSY